MSVVSKGCSHTKYKRDVDATEQCTTCLIEHNTRLVECLRKLAKAVKCDEPTGSKLWLARAEAERLLGEIEEG